MMRAFVAPVALCFCMSACFHGATPSVVPGLSSAAFGAHPFASHGYKTVFAFNGADGSSPNGPLIAVKDNLYGTTSSGGNWSTGGGTAFVVSTAGKERVLHSFGRGTDGKLPVENLTLLNDTLYGTTSYGGDFDGGAVFSVSLAGSEHVLHSFGKGKDGKLPGVGLTAFNGTLYGMTAQGGKYDGGTIYSITAAGKEAVVYNFPRAYGVNFGGSAGALTLLHGIFYGATVWGGCDNGAAFRATPAGKVRILHKFACGSGSEDGANPDCPLVAVGNILYGTTSSGGGPHQSNVVGTVYSLTTSGKEAVVHSFGAKGDGAYPECRLLYDKGVLYGETLEGGANGKGTVFSLTPSGKERVLYSFVQRPDGEEPDGGLINVDGILYGTTDNGGGYPYGGGTIFSISP